jgi:hypothetical protein
MPYMVFQRAPSNAGEVLELLEKGLGCTVADWRIHEVRSGDRPATKEHPTSTGAANFFYAIALEGTSFKILAESSKVIERHVSATGR